MGVCFESSTLPDAVIERLVAEPPLVWRLLAPDEPEAWLDEIGAGRRPGFIARLLGATETPVPDTVPNVEVPADARFSVDLDKAWDGINHCVKQLAPDAPVNLFEGGQAIGRIEVGYGPAIAFTSRDVAQLHATYAAIAPDDVLRVRRETDMRRVYPRGLWDDDRDDADEYLLDSFRELQTFLATAAGRGLGVLNVYA